MTKDALAKVLLLMISLPLLFSCVATQQDVLALNRQIRNINTRLNKMEAVREKQAEAGAEIDSVKEELQRLSGLLEEDRHLIKHAIERNTTEKDVLNARLAKLESEVLQLHKYLNIGQPSEPKKQLFDEGSKEASGVAPQTSALEEYASPENRLYEDTLSLYRDGKYDEAIAGFKNFLKNHPQSGLADNAQFWIGESYMALTRYEQAILAYQEVITKYPQGNKVPNAMLKQALAFNEIKDTVSSRLLLKKIIKKYPDSAEAKIAEAKLKTIK